MKTRTGSFPIGFLCNRQAWQQDLAGTIAWAKGAGLEFMDLLKEADKTAPQVINAGFKVGAVFLQEWEGMISADKAKRADAIAKNTAYVKACAALGITKYFLVMLPENPGLPRKENFGYMVDSFGQLAPALEANNARLIIEGWPGPGALCCTPEGYRAFFKQVPSKAMGVNYDPSHLLRMGIDPLRFLSEFGERVYHVHGKDTEFISENLYEYGSEQPGTFADAIPFGGYSWRYTIPGHGVARWGAILRQLSDLHYTGGVSIEFEDAHFLGSDAAEKEGVVFGARFLEGV